MPVQTAGPRQSARPLRDAGDLKPLMDRIGDTRVVCIGEASHGTHEYNEWRATLTRRLIEERDFAFVGVEGDWPDCYDVHCSVTAATGSPEDPRVALAGFERWLTWMWANEEVVDFTRWLRQHNLGQPVERRVTPSTSRPPWQPSAASSRTPRTRRPTRGPPGGCPPAANSRWSPC